MLYTAWLDMYMLFLQSQFEVGMLHSYLQT